MYRDEGLVLQVERFRNAANTHWLTGMLHQYWNCGVIKFMHLYPLPKQQEIEDALRRFVFNKGVFREMTKDEEDLVYKKLGWKK
jgi:hypothetical protein